jgi:adenylate cyclase
LQPEDNARRMAVVLAADVVGYSRLMGADEAGTLARLKAHRRELIDPTVEACHGRIVKLMGDGALVEFASVVDALRCAATVQRGMAGRNAAVPEAERIEFRIGINLGDVIVEGDDLYGDGVNIAARLQTLAEPGGICISGTAFDHALHKLDVGFKDIGEQRLKNIADPVRVYRVLLDPAAAGRVVHARRPWPRRALAAAIALLVLMAAGAAAVWLGTRPTGPPSVAVLPFDNLGDDPEQEYFADGITEDLITDLAKISGLVVIARNSTFAYKGRPVDAQEVARELGVRYVIEGSVRRAGDRIRINAQLTDSETGGHLWANRFDRDAADIFAVQDEVIRRIVDALSVELTTTEETRLARPPTDNLEAYDYYLRAEQAANSGDRRAVPRALSLYHRATAVDPAFADAYAAFARVAVYILRNSLDEALTAPVARKLAYEMAGRALSLRPETPAAYSALAELQLWDRAFEEAIASARQAVSLGPSDADAHFTLGLVLAHAGEPAEATAAVETALRLNPKPPPRSLVVAGSAFLMRGEYARAVEFLEDARTSAPLDSEANNLLIVAYMRSGRPEDARKEAARSLDAYPSINLQFHRIAFSHLKRDRDLELLLDALSEAGIPEWPYGFRGDPQARLDGDAIRALALGKVWQGQLEGGAPAILQISADGRTAYRTPSALQIGTAFIDGSMLCERNDTFLLNRPRCGHVYRRAAGSGDGRYGYVYVNADKLFYFSVSA